MKKKKLLTHWYEYLVDIYKDDRSDMPEIIEEVESPITKREVEHALRGVSMKKAPGTNDSITEMIVAAGEIGVSELTKLSNMMYSQGSFPSELNKSIFITGTLQKVNDTSTV